MSGVASIIDFVGSRLVPLAWGPLGAPGGGGDQPLRLDRILPPELSDLSDLSRWGATVQEFVTTRGITLLSNMAGALVIFILGRWIAMGLTRVVRRVATQARVDETLVKFSSHLVYAGLLSFVALSALNRLGVDTTSFTAVVAAAGLAIGFALQGSLANFAAGVMLIMFKPFKVGDTIAAGGSTGVVQEIQIFNTLLKTSDNALVIVPNSTVTNGVITNFSTEKTRRIDLTAKCGYDCDLRDVKRFLTQLALDDDRILRLPPPTVCVEQLADNHVVFLVQPWVRREDYAAVRADLLEGIKTGFEEHGYRIAAPTQAPATGPRRMVA